MLGGHLIKGSATRLKLFLDWKKVNQRTLLKSIKEVPNSILLEILRDGRELDWVIIKAIKKAFPDISAQWVMFDLGMMVTPKNSKDKLTKGQIIARNIRAIRLKHAYSQKQMAGLLDRDRTVYVLMEKGEVKFNAVDIVTLYNHFKEPLENILLDKGNEEQLSGN